MNKYDKFYIQSQHICPTFISFQICFFIQCRIPKDHSPKLSIRTKETLNNLQIIRKENFPITEIITRHKGHDDSLVLSPLLHLKLSVHKKVNNKRSQRYLKVRLVLAETSLFALYIPVQFFPLVFLRHRLLVQEPLDLFFLHPVLRAHSDSFAIPIFLLVPGGVLGSVNPGLYREL